MRDEGPDPEHALLERDFPERQARDVHQELGLREPHVQRRDEALAAREHLGARTPRQLERLGGRSRLLIGKRRRLHLPNLLVEVVMITSEEDTMTVLGSICAALLFAVAQIACAQGYPSQPIRLIAPFPPGGSVDITARLIAEPLGTQLGTRIVIDNRSGASGNIGMEAAARAKPDGTTLVLNTLPLVANPSLFDKLSWDPLKDFVPIGMVATSPHILVVANRLPATTVEELVRLAQAS